MSLLDSLLDAIIRLEGDALVMHVGEKPYVVTTSEATSQFRGPLAWGQVELSSRILTLEAVTGMLGQILPIDQRAALSEFGATEFAVTAANNPAERFTIVAARGGDDIWLEVRRHPKPGVESFEQVEQPLPSAPTNEVTVRTTAPAEAPADTANSLAQVSATEGASLEHLTLEAQAAPEGPAEVPAAQTAAVAAADAPVEQTLRLEEEPEDAFTRAVPLVEEALGFDQFDHEESEPEQTLLVVEAWGDDVMTEGELSELLRPSAPAIITGDTSEGTYDFTPDFVAPPTVPDVSVVEDAWPDEPLVIPDETAEQTFADEEVDAAPHAAPNVASAVSESVPVAASQSASESAAREVVLAEQEALWAAHAPPVEVEYFAITESEGPVDVRESMAASELSDISVIDETGISEEAPAAVDGWEPEPEHARGIGQEPGPTADRVAESVEQDEQEEQGDEDVAPARPAAVILPLTRPTRPEAAPDSRGGAGTLERIVRLSAARGAATVYLVGQAAPLVRVDGEFSALEGEAAVEPALIERLTNDLAPRGRDDAAAPASEWLIEVPEIGRVRCTAFRDHRGPGLILRMVPQRAISADQLGLPAEVQALCSEAEGLVLVTGGRGSGKSTLLTSFVDLINRTRSDHVITLESQIEFLHENKRSFISQREVRGDTDTIVAAVRGACREEPDVLIIEDLRTPELVSLALEAADSGRLVFGSVPAPSAVLAIERVIEVFPPERREKVQASLSGALRGVVSQVLLRKLRGGRVAAREVLLNTSLVANLILEGETFQLPAALENGRRVGMMPFAESLATLVREGVVHPAHAYRKAPNREQFLAVLRREGVDISIAERLA